MLDNIYTAIKEQPVPVLTSNPSQETLQPVTVVISTFNRGNSIASTIESILKNDYTSFILRVIDQSDNDLTEKAVQPYLADPRFVYRRSTTRGSGTGRNLGISAASTELIAVTDDDCVVPAGWIRQVVEAFNLDERIGVVFGNVLPAPYDQSEGFIPTYIRSTPYLARSIKDKNKVRGIGACMALRRSAWLKVNGFDQKLGPGSPFKACEEGDFAIKALLAGYYVYESPEINLAHFGFRTWDQGRLLARRNWFGVGAALAKHLKAGHWPVLYIIAYEWFVIGLLPFLKNLVSEHRFSGITPLVSFAHGFLVGLLNPVDRRTGNYKD